MRLALALLLALAAPARGADWRLVSADSRVTFTYLENGTPRTGLFSALAGEARFDPDRLADTRVRLTIVSAGIDLGDPVRSFFAQSVDWFDAAIHPAVEVEIDRLLPAGPDLYRAEGRVRIKGRTVPVTPDVTVTDAGGRLRASGTIRIDRHDYALGVGFSALFLTVAREVEVRFDLAGEPAQRTLP